MAASFWRRGVLLVILLGALFGLAVCHGSLEPDPTVGAYPGAEQLGTDYDRYLGERVSMWGRVVATDPVVIEVGYAIDQAIRLRLVGLDPSLQVSEGTRLIVYGVVQPDRTIAVLNAVPVAERGILYTYSISFLAGLWVLGRLMRYWRVEPGDWTIRRRSTPLLVSDRLRERLQEARRDA